MDGKDFDTWVQWAAKNASRRRVVAATLIALAEGLVPGRPGGDAYVRPATARRRRGRSRRDSKPSDHRQASADGKKHKKACPPCKGRRKGKCKRVLPDGSACPGGTCQNGTCVPACIGSCTNRQCGDDGCGASCGTCETDRVCQAGSCALVCDQGLTACDGLCTNLQEDHAHCGACTTACASDQVCVSGACVCDASACESFQACAGNSCVCDALACGAQGGCCAGDLCPPTNTQNDPNNCGSCGHHCQAPANATATCVSGSCEFTCHGGFHRCGNACFADDDPTHCGVTCTACDSGARCVGGICCSGLAPSDDLQAAIDAASTGDTLELCAGTWNLTSTLSLHQDVTLTGAGAGETVLDGGKAIRVLLVQLGAAATLEALTITRGKSNGSGAGILTKGELILLNCQITQCEATDQNGGGVYVDLGTLRASGSTLGANTASSGGGLYNSGGTVSLEDDTVIRNNTASWKGGGIDNDYGTLTIVDSRVSENTAGNGGGIYAEYGLLTLTNSSVSDNTSYYDGAGIDLHGAGVTLGPNAMVTNNLSVGPGGWKTFGGGLHLTGLGGYSEAVTIKSGSVVAGNSANYGGGISITGGFGSITMEEGSSVTANHARDYGGGIFLRAGAATLHAGSDVSENTAAVDGGGVYNLLPPGGSGAVTLADTMIVTSNYLDDEITSNNCGPVNTIPQCIG